jgi:hypothetical protein
MLDLCEMAAGTGCFAHRGLRMGDAAASAANRRAL